ncbi:MAG TPA: M48 family metallopeptidase [Candidatus Sulfotelmatobacter sp.]|nr:M48 family metallopeptidase [Candidatus Sulfotelmatobacter sp.]
MKGRLHFPCVPGFLLAVILVSAPGAFADRTKLKPGMNSFTPQQDIELGRKFASEAEKQYPLCNDPKIDAYLTKLGHRLSDHLNTFGNQYPWEFHCVNDKAINAFALPGGFVFVNRGAIEAADYEAELAGVMAHELSHVALRHGTNQATKARYAELGSGIVGIAGDIFGGLAGAAVAGAGQFAAGSVLLKYSRGAETQADVMGTQVLYDSGFDPRALAAFFEKLNSSAAPPEFFSDHPNPDHRVERVDEEIQKMGGVLEGAQRDSPEFEAIKREVAALPVVNKPKAGAPAGGAGSAFPQAGTVKVAPPSGNYVGLDIGLATLKYPDNWNKYAKGSNVTLAPEGGIVDPGNGQPALAYGVMASLAKFSGTTPSGQDVLKLATEKLIESMQQENANMRITRESKAVTVDGERALSTYLRNDAPAGGLETDWLITVMRPEGLVYFVFVAPQPEFNKFSTVYGSIVDSIQFTR